MDSEITCTIDADDVFVVGIDLMEGSMLVMVAGILISPIHDGRIFFIDYDSHGADDGVSALRVGHQLLRRRCSRRLVGRVQRQPFLLAELGKRDQSRTHHRLSRYTHHPSNLAMNLFSRCCWNRSKSLLSNVDGSI